MRRVQAALLVAMLCAVSAAHAEEHDLLLGKTVFATSPLDPERPWAGPIVDYVYFPSSGTAIHGGVFETTRSHARSGRYKVKHAEALLWQLMAVRDDQPAIAIRFEGDICRFFWGSRPAVDCEIVHGNQIPKPRR
jgi:hypothetical protein